MADILLKRVSRLISSNLSHWLAALERSCPEQAYTQAMAEVDSLADSIRHEFGQVSASKYQADKQRQQLQQQHRRLAMPLTQAVDSQRDDLAQTIIAEQLQLESQIQSIAVQLRTLSDRENELNTFLKALSAKQYELRSELDLVREHSQQQDIPHGPFSNTTAPLGSIIGDSHLTPVHSQQLAELEQLSQEQQIAERLAATKAQRQHTTAEPAAADVARPRNHEH
ncbi:PspA/IM30 family protein [Pokkaliibacter sp. MBI-7]|uniref:PspA/IM30 family protein n=1 Tax=Pokkaliibacter sp. MBI-7 TaxID=3040600 RepID=UPI0024497E2B|nr:PspA/IM30 family protein [Pokkaliibacter sp. MBI-7]MDH2432331.1 PspA/IM30 family protein [Pokkaliibacter sp. MBI-7]